ncbi:MAG TPA: trypsin-like peptidase domain-containing protein [candidate division Zixibacteria bacterium]|nr:trypsin-like peptidase domain-containing protein [candidate division Zixibacteria bacterium]
MSNQISSLQILKSLSDATSELVQRLAPSVVNVNSRMTRGTGTVITADGYIATCNHVLGRSAEVRIGTGEKSLDAKLVGFDPYSDVALLKAEGGRFKPVEFGDSDKLSTGQFVLALANPFNRQPTATTGIITNVGATLRGWRGTAMENVIATDAKLHPGFSGGPLIDVSGKVIGLNTAYVWSRGIAIPANKVKNIIDRLMTGGKLRRAYLGIVSNTVSIPQEIASQADMNQDSGVMVFQVEQGTPAKKAGLTMGDVIVKFNEKPVTTFYDLPQLLTEDVIGKETILTILREEKLMQLTITPAVAESEEDD